MSNRRARMTDVPEAPANPKRRFLDRKTGFVIVKIFQGECYVTEKDEILSTILGSCIAACIRDPVAGIGGMNHFLLPYGQDNGGGHDGHPEDMGAALRYGNFSMEQLINEIMKRGGDRRRLEVKVFGGGNVLKSGMNIGHTNATFVEKYLSEEGIPIIAKDLRGTLPRAVRYFPNSGRVLVRSVDANRSQEIASEEQKRRVRVAKTEKAGEIELFD